MRRSRLTESSTTSILRCGPMRSGNFRPRRVWLMQKSRVVIYFFALLVVGVPAAGAQNPPRAAVLPPDPVVGAWTLNLAKSKYVTPAPKSMTVTIAPAERGYAFTIDAVGPDGQPQKWGYVSAFERDHQHRCLRSAVGLATFP